LIASGGRTTKFDIDEKTSTASASADVDASSILSEAGYSSTDPTTITSVGIQTLITLNGRSTTFDVDANTPTASSSSDWSAYWNSSWNVFASKAGCHGPSGGKYSECQEGSDSGKVIGVISVGQDITERKQFEEEKTRVAQELQTFIDTANAPIFGIDENVLVNEWNNKAVEITGYTRDEVMGQNLVERFITEEYRVSVIGVFDRALNGQEAANFEFPLFTKDMRRVEVLLNATTRRDVDGRNIGIISVGQDITDRKEEEVQMTRVAQELQTFIDTVNAPIFGIDENVLVNEWNNKAVEITVYSKTRGTTTRFENVATISSAATLNKSAVSSPSNASVISNSGAPPSTS
jgi:PAS domain S-box-containing protein